MTPQEVKEALQKIVDETTVENTYYKGQYHCAATEEGHMDADAILVKFVRSLGYTEIADLYCKIGKWYS